MPKDYATKKRPSASKKQVKNNAPGWLWLLTGLFLGAFIMFLTKLSDTQPPRKVEKNKISQSKSQIPAKPSKEKPRFDFYELLKENEVKVDSSPEKPLNRSKEKSTIEYILQVASFKNEPDAERLRAELLLLNLNAKSQKAIVRNGETWHRVLVGPFSSRSKLAKARSTLVSNRYEALVLKREK